MSHWSSVLAAVVIVSGFGPLGGANCSNNGVEDADGIAVKASNGHVAGSAVDAVYPPIFGPFLAEDSR